MKKRFVISLVIFFCLSQIFCGCIADNNNEKYDLIRIHIRADSNLQEAQGVKLKVRDSVTNYLTAELSGVVDFAKAYSMIGERLESIATLVIGTLSANGFGYGAKVKLNNEYFPTRDYDGIVVVSGYYDALIIELGSGKGDNWWCVIYPPLCYVVTDNGSKDFRYKSWISEMYQKFFNKHI